MAAPVQKITLEAGTAFADNFMTRFQAGFKGNNHAETLKGILADKLSWDWSDDTKGEGSPETLTDIFAKSWGFMVDSFNVTSKNVVVDTTHGKIVMFVHLLINITGGLADETNLVHNPVVFTLTLNDKEQVTHWEGYWNQANAEMLSGLGKVMGRLEEAKKE